jgi:NAD(P)H-flavin reductase/hemoglobin-like flavoprotein
VDTQRLKDSFALVAKHGGEVVLSFYADLFLRAPEARDMFPVVMSATRDRLLAALGSVVSDVDNLEALVPYLQGLGRDHRRFGAQPEHFALVGASLLATLEKYAGDAWTPELEEDWKAAYALVAQVMVDAARDDEANPAFYEAGIIGFERRTPDVAVIRVITKQPLPYQPGQSVAVECDEVPRWWRWYSPANAPRADGTIDFHVRRIDDGMLSSALVRRVYPGTRLRLGPAVGTLTLDLASERDILLVAGSTGLAPLKAIIEQVAHRPRPPFVHLFFGATSAEGLYDRASLDELESQYPWLSVTYAVSDPDHSGPEEAGSVVEAVLRSGQWGGHDAYVCGPLAMVRAATEELVTAGMHRDQLHTEDFGWEL